jgi:hypothetical protein
VSTPGATPYGVLDDADDADAADAWADRVGVCERSSGMYSDMTLGE